METFRLKSMVDFVLENAKQPYVEGTKYKDLVNYANFLKQPLEKWMFVPCDENGNVLEEPKTITQSIIDNDNSKEWAIKTFEYRQAKSLCLFEVYSFESDSENFWYFGKDELTLIAVDISESIESLVEYNLTLTTSAIKKLGL